MRPAGPSIAVVGDGPRALWALERLAALLDDDDAVPPSRIVVFGTAPLGAGRVYDSSQPDFLRLNVPSRSVDVWGLREDGGPSLDTWRERRSPGSTEDQFPARALTGAYLAEQAGVVLAELRARLGAEAVEIRSETIDGIRPAEPGPGWALDDRGTFDEVLLAVGHSTRWPGALTADGSSEVPLQASVFPVADLIARPEVRPGATIAVRGAALTAIDAVLALTVGRGHRPADSDLQIVLVSRTGRLMYPKSDPAVVQERLDQVGDLEPLRRAIAAGEPVLPIVQELAARLLGGGTEARRAIRSAEPGAIDQGDPEKVLRSAIEMARGEREPDGWWALGQAWRTLYADLVARQRATAAAGPPLGWADYHRWSAELERVAFGPPLVNAELLLEGVSSGRVRVMKGEIRTVCPEADLVVDAVLPPPGIVDLPGDSLLGRLRDAGVLTRVGERRGAHVGDDARVLDSAGRPVPGLALVGRATEDDVLGNDTLIRDLHPQVDAWARSVLA